MINPVRRKWLVRQLMQPSAVIHIHSNVAAAAVTMGVIRRSSVHQMTVNTLLEVHQADTALALATRKGRYSIYPSNVRGLWR